MQEIAESGIIDRSGRLRLPMDRLNAEFARRPGQRVIAKFSFVERGSSQAQQGYYYGYILPCVMEALRKQGTRYSEAMADRWLVHEYPGDFGEKTIARQLDKSEMTDFLEWLQQYAAENLEIYIEDPNVL